MAEPEEVADGVWRVTEGSLSTNVFLLREGEGVAVFDAGHKDMGKSVREAADSLGGATRVVLGNSHPDHRGGAKQINAPVFCHPDERADAEGDGGQNYFNFERLPRLQAALAARSMKSWDDGPVEVAGTVVEGDPVSDFTVVELPGHSPGCIGLWRERDRLALSNDCFARFDPAELSTMLRKRTRYPRVPHAAFNWDSQKAWGSLRKLQRLEPETCWPAHFDALVGDVPGSLGMVSRPQYKKHQRELF